MSPQTQLSAPKSAIGRSRWGGSSAVLLSLSIGLGIVSGTGLGLAAQWVAPVSDRPWWLLPVAIMATTTLPSCALWWVLFVDRSTLRGATPNPEESIEAQWYEKAASAAFTISIAVIGVAAAAFSIMRWNVDSGLLLAGACMVMVLCFAGSFLVIKRRES